MASGLTGRLMKISIYLNAGIWFSFGIIVLAGLNSGISSNLSFRITIAVLSFSAGGAMISLDYLARRFSHRWYYFLLAELMLIIVLTVTDEFGWPDAAVLISHVFTFVLLARRLK